MADSIIAKIQTLFSDKNKSEILFPRTKVKAVSDDDGTALNVLLDEMNTATSVAATNAATAQSTADNAVSAANTHIANTSNPHGVTKSQVGLGNVTNDKQMPIAGGTFTGNAVAYSTNRTTSGLRNIEVRTSSATGTLQSTNKIIMVRK